MDERAMRPRAPNGGAMRLITRLMAMALFAVAALINGQAALAQAQSEPPRLALIIANQSYAEDVGPLANPHNDARLIAEALGAHGFEIVGPRANPSGPWLDLSTRGAILAAVEVFAARLDAAGTGAIGFFYYAGHGLSRPNTQLNYLIPTGLASMEGGLAVWGDSVRLEEIRDTLARVAPSAQHIVVFDACRNELQLGRSGRSRGFDSIAPVGGMLLAFSTEFGELAADGDEDAGSGPFAEALAAELRIARGVSAAELFSRVRQRFVSNALAQRPYYTDRLDRPVVFGERTIDDEERCDAAELGRIFETIDRTNPAELRAFAALCPGSLQAQLAAALADQIAATRGGAAPPPVVVQPPPTPRIETTTSPLDGATVFLTGEASLLEPLSLFRECDVCPEMVALPGGTFTMGSPESEEGRRSNEGRQQRVTIQPFAMGRTEVTVGQFRRFVEATGRETGDQCWVFENGAWNARSGRSWRNPGFEQTDRSPVVCVNWDDARAYISWLNDQVSGSPYRLPSEAEWEYAARGGAQSAYSWGPNITRSNANYGAETCCRGEASGADRWVNTAPVGQFQSNPFGLYDAHGNVWEWVQDCWTASLDASLRTGQARMTGDCSTAVLRGGSWFFTPDGLRSAFRDWSPRGDRSVTLGFRLARTLLE